MLEPQTLARPYADALFSYAKQQQQLTEWLNILALLAHASQYPGLGEWLNSSVAAEIKVEVLLKIVGPSGLPVDGLPIKNLLVLLAEKKRLSLLIPIYERFALHKHQYEKIQVVNLVSAYPLSQAEQSDLSQQLRNQVGRDIELNITVDAQLLGGVVIEMGDTILDYSVKGQLNQLAQGLLAAAA